MEAGVSEVPYRSSVGESDRSNHHRRVAESFAEARRLLEGVGFKNVVVSRDSPWWVTAGGWSDVL